MTSAAELPLVVMATDSAVPSGVGEHMLTLARVVGGECRVTLAFPPTASGLAFLTRAGQAGLAAQPIDSDDAFRDWLKDNHASLLHVHAGIGWEGHGLTGAGRAAGVPVVRTEHLPYMLTEEAQKIEHRLGTSLVNKTICVSQASSDTYRDAGFFGPRMATICNGIEVSKASRPRAETRIGLGIAETALIALTVARFTAQKDYRLLLAAVPAVHQALPDVRFVLVGDGPDRVEIEQIALATGLDDVVIFLGAREDVPDLMAAADLFVLPSRFEGLPLVLLEALSMGLPVVATRIGGNSEAVGEDYPWMVEPGNRENLSVTITSALRDADQRRKVAARNRKRFHRHFRADRMGRETVALYRSVISEKACAA